MLALNGRVSVLEMPKVLNRHKTLGNKEPSPVYKSEYVNGKKILLKKNQEKSMNENQTSESCPFKSLKDP